MIKKVNTFTKNELIREINVLGPWVHGYFDLGNGIVIQDQDELQKKRLFKYKDYFLDIIRGFYDEKDIKEKTICDIGCNAGYFLFELMRELRFKLAVGLEPRESNLNKARFIADYFKLNPSKICFQKFDVLTNNHKLPLFDIVLMPGVLYHVDNHLCALSNVYKMTKELCIIETLVLPDEINSKQIADSLELKDEVYQKLDGYFGVVGYKAETSNLDGATFHDGMVGFPTVKALIMMLHHVGFSSVNIYKSPAQLKEEVFNAESYRDYKAVIVTASKKIRNNEWHKPDYESIQKNVDREAFNAFIPKDVIGQLYECVMGVRMHSDLSNIAKLIYISEKNYLKVEAGKAAKELSKIISDEKILRIIKTFKHAFEHKVTFEYAKTCYHLGLLAESEAAIQELAKIVNLDWRTVYKLYYLLARIYYDTKKIELAKKMNELSLRAYENYYPAIQLKQLLRSQSKKPYA